MAITLIMGASDDPSRFAFMALQQLTDHGIQVVLVNPKGGNIAGHTVFQSPSDVPETIDTVTLYIRPELVEQQMEKIAETNPRRIIFNPGTESRIAADYFASKGIQVVNACTLIMLQNGHY